MQAIQYDSVKVLGVHLTLGLLDTGIALEGEADEELLGALAGAERSSDVWIADELKLHLRLSLTLDLLGVVIAWAVIGDGSREDSDVSVLDDLLRSLQHLFGRRHAGGAYSFGGLE